VPADVNSLIEELQIFLTTDARVYDTQLSVTLAPGLPRVMGSPIQLQQLVLNLVRNAFEAMVEMPAGDRAVTLATLRNGSNDIEIRVSDNGPGIDPGIADRLFDPFATTKKSGTGLGLAISRTIAQSHGGTIHSRPATPRGTSFHVCLPVSEGFGA